ncbi:hypothetical protein [Sporosarcina sp. G11-34]|uniref:hypothetical protein n=1 Tax=Sporosarcina sp. G11-34 TaxID=2849605 RepID=UPI0022A93CCE|nr:hypothetical protein [Sporosarcina sp. G11-34]MCZ2258637.1 hypothetical protein [Sporosarcina sp. G11-34]
MDYILMEKQDIKSFRISEELKKSNIKVIFLPNNPIYNIFKIIKCLFKYGKPKAIIYRYLNDFDNLPKNLLKILFENIEYNLMKILKSKVLWICHNIDRETYVYSKKINSYRRRLLLRYVDKVFVTDPELKEVAIKYLHIEENDLSYITFGNMSNGSEVYPNQDFIYEKIVDFVENEKRVYKDKVYFTFCAGKANHKTEHYRTIKRLIEEGEKKNIIIRAIIIGPLEEYYLKKDSETLRFLKIDSRVLFINGFYRFNEKEFEGLIDFYWRVYSDYSMPGTVYKAVELRKPIITMNLGILPKVIEKNDIGFVIDNKFSNIGNVFNSLNSIPSSNYKDFETTHSWEIAAQNIMRVINGV